MIRFKETDDALRAAVVLGNTHTDHFVDCLVQSLVGAASRNRAVDSARLAAVADERALARNPGAHFIDIALGIVIAGIPGGGAGFGEHLAGAFGIFALASDQREAAGTFGDTGQHVYLRI